MIATIANRRGLRDIGPASRGRASRQRVTTRSCHREHVRPFSRVLLRGQEGAEAFQLIAGQGGAEWDTRRTRGAGRAWDRAAAAAEQRQAAEARREVERLHTQVVLASIRRHRAVDSARKLLALAAALVAALAWSSTAAQSKT